MLAKVVLAFINQI